MVPAQPNKDDIRHAGLATARRNLADRIDRFLKDAMAPKAADITLWQLDQVMVAIEHLELDEFAEGERLMMKVEKAATFEPVGYVSPATNADVGKLCERLQRVLAG